MGILPIGQTPGPSQTGATPAGGPALAEPRPATRPAWRFRWGERGPLWLAAQGPRLLGVLNVTPDSFTDGGRYRTPNQAVRHALYLLESGADAIDVGAESTRPGHTPLSPDAEWERLGPVLRSLVRELAGTPISVDTYHADVAMRALDQGAYAVNDVSGLSDPNMLSAVAHGKGALMVCHWRPGEREASPEAVRSCLLDLYDRAVAAGLPADTIALDPGLGFSKAPHVSWTLLRHLSDLTGTGHPILVGASRKGFVGRIAEAPPTGAHTTDLPARDQVTGLVSLYAAERHVALLRVHEPRPTRQALAVLAALDGSGARP